MRHLAKEAHYLASGGVRGSGSGVDRQSMGGSVRRYGATLGLVVFCVTGGTLTPTAAQSGSSAESNSASCRTSRSSWRRA